eukprot:6340753-Amphidinium_carterae.1
MSLSQGVLIFLSDGKGVLDNDRRNEIRHNKDSNCDEEDEEERQAWHDMSIQQQPEYSLNNNS